MGQVYRARDTRLNREVATKVPLRERAAGAGLQNFSKRTAVRSSGDSIETRTDQGRCEMVPHSDHRCATVIVREGRS
jgi:hypothetical protein